ncbi:5949_t:CDS:2, partial [Racocetra fulgida]
GNILIDRYSTYSDLRPTIADLGISKPINELSDKNAIYGIIPYVAPEVLIGEKFIQASDIYSWNKLKKLREEERSGGLANALDELIKKANKGEIKFPENIDTSILLSKINDQAIYSSQPLTQFISKALTLQSDSKAIYFNINKR